MLENASCGEIHVAKDKVTRRLAAIFAADMVGYSRLMEADEEGTIARQKAHRSALINPKIAEHDGRIVKLMGDGMLAEFASVVDAVRCAVEMQKAMAEREADVPDDRRIQYRVGVNLGDIVIDGDDILGDGVNVAARLEGLAEPGVGSSATQAARNYVRLPDFACYRRASLRKRSGCSTTPSASTRCIRSGTCR